FAQRPITLTAAALIRIHPVPERAFVDALVPGHLRDRLASLPDQPYRASLKSLSNFLRVSAIAYLLKAMCPRSKAKPSGTFPSSSALIGLVLNVVGAWLRFPAGSGWAIFWGALPGADPSFAVWASTWSSVWSSRLAWTSCASNSGSGP